MTEKSQRFTFNWIVPRLAQGGAFLLATKPQLIRGFEMVVILTKEFKEPESRKMVLDAKPDAEFRYLAMDDVPEYLDVPGIKPQLHELAREIAERVRWGVNVYVACMEGRNRSGLVVGLALTHLGWSGAAAVDLVQANRPNALTRKAFADYVRSIPSRHSKG